MDNELHPHLRMSNESAVQLRVYLAELWQLLADLASQITDDNVGAFRLLAEAQRALDAARAIVAPDPSSCEPPPIGIGDELVSDDLEPPPFTVVQDCRGEVWFRVAQGGWINQDNALPVAWTEFMGGHGPLIVLASPDSEDPS